MPKPRFRMKARLELYSSIALAYESLKWLAKSSPRPLIFKWIISFRRSSWSFYADSDNFIKRLFLQFVTRVVKWASRSTLCASTLDDQPVPSITKDSAFLLNDVIDCVCSALRISFSCSQISSNSFRSSFLTSCSTLKNACCLSDLSCASKQGNSDVRTESASSFCIFLNTVLSYYFATSA